MFMISLHTESHPSNSSISLVIVVKPQGKFICVASSGVMFMPYFMKIR